MWNCSIHMMHAVFCVCVGTPKRCGRVRSVGENEKNSIHLCREQQRNTLYYGLCLCLCGSEKAICTVG